jgi:hypothetical protein
MVKISTTPETQPSRVVWRRVKPSDLMMIEFWLVRAKGGRHRRARELCERVVAARSSLPLHGWKPASAVLTLEPLLSLKRCLPSPSSLPEALHLVVTRVVLEEAQGDLQFGTLSRAANRKNAQVCTKQSQRRQSGILEGGWQLSGPQELARTDLPVGQALDKLLHLPDLGALARVRLGVLDHAFDRAANRGRRARHRSATMIRSEARVLETDMMRSRSVRNQAVAGAVGKRKR